MAQDRVILWYPNDNSGWNLVLRLQNLDILHSAWGMGQGHGLIPELCTPEGKIYIGYKEITEYLDVQQPSLVGPPIPRRPSTN